MVEPGCRRRFLRACRHISVTIEPAHPLYRSFLAWSSAQGRTALDISADEASALAGEVDRLQTPADMDLWLRSLLMRFGWPAQAEVNSKLQALLNLLRRVEAGGTPTQAESVWPAFTALYPGSTSAHARWLKDQIGLSLRQFLLWRKLRSAMDLLASPLDATTIAHAAGFADSSHLWRTCTRAFGLQPSRAADRKTVQVRVLQFS